MKKVFILLFLIFIAGCDHMEKKACFKDKCIDLEVMESLEEKSTGLMFRDSLEENKGLLFVYDYPEKRGFWMKNVKFPIDIIWLNQENKIVHIERNVPRCIDNCKIYYPDIEAYNIIEVNANFTLENDVKVWDIIEII